MKFDKQKSWSRSQAQTEGSLWEICLFAIFFILIFSAVARADQKPLTPGATVDDYQYANQPTSAVGTSLEMKQLRRKGYGDFWAPVASLTVETTRPIEDDGNPSYAGSYALTLGTANDYRGWSATTKLGYEREYTYEKDDGTDGQVSNPTLTIAKTFKDDKWATSHSALWKVFDSISLATTGSLPGNKEAQDHKKFQGSLGASLKFAKAIGILSITQGFGYSHGFYEYDIRDDGTVNSPEQYTSTTELSLKVTEKLALSASVLLARAVSYQGVPKGNETSSASIDYTFNPHVSASLGVQTDRPTLLPDGQSDRVQFLDPTVAQASLDLVIGI